MSDSGSAADAENFMNKYRDPQTKKFRNVTATQFLEVWSHYDTDNNGYIEGGELDNFIEEFILSVIPGGKLKEALSATALKEVKEDFLLAYDDNEDNRIEIGELAQLLPTDETFLLLFRRDNPLASSVEFMKVWRQFDTDKSGYIEIGELQRFLQHLLANSRGDEELSADKLSEYTQSMLTLFDKDMDGRLQISEMARLVPVKENILNKPILKNAGDLTYRDIDRVFRKYDCDKSGSLDGDELNALLKDILDLVGEDYTEEKLKECRAALLAEWDANKNLKIDKDELQLLLMRQKRMAEEAKVAGQLQ